ncbi:SMC-Scp complex subunit ScpB [Synechococcus sp. M16CYN]|uniref:SMC-Scp complex subunit ScpB n=1 Tax=Synechococcus sp. M16CYN TaxID=3103139 RepID=UPI00324E29AA
MLSLSLTARLEAILYLKGRPLSINELAELSQTDHKEVEKALTNLTVSYAQRETAFEIIKQNDRFGLQIHAGLADLAKDLLPVKLSTATVRTLAVIALKGSVLQSDLVDIRGSGAYDHIKELLAQELIERRKQEGGRSYWITPTEKFHHTFSVLPGPDSTDPARAA